MKELPAANAETKSARNAKKRRGFRLPLTIVIAVVAIACYWIPGVSQWAYSITCACACLLGVMLGEKAKNYFRDHPYKGDGKYHQPPPE